MGSISSPTNPLNNQGSRVFHCSTGTINFGNFSGVQDRQVGNGDRRFEFKIKDLVPGQRASYSGDLLMMLFSLNIVDGSEIRLASWCW